MDLVRDPLPSALCRKFLYVYMGLCTCIVRVIVYVY